MRAQSSDLQACISHISLGVVGGRQSPCTRPASAGPAEEREVSLTVPRCHRCSSAAAASRSCSTVRVSARALGQLKEGAPHGAGVARQEATLASRPAIGGGGSRDAWPCGVAMCEGHAVWAASPHACRLPQHWSSWGHDQQERSPFRLRLSFTASSREEIV